MKIRDLQVLRLKGVRQPSEGFAGWIQCNPSQVFDSSPPSPSRFKASRDRGPMAYEALYLQVLTDTGPNGLYGPIDAEAAIVILRQLKPAVVGMDPLRVEETWERLFRMNRHSRAGHYMMGISAIDNALWDVRGSAHSSIRSRADASRYTAVASGTRSSRKPRGHGAGRWPGRASKGRSGSSPTDPPRGGRG
jgi:L-rhamnonate dehydratase